MAPILSLLALGALALPSILAHPGASKVEINAEAAARTNFLKRNPHSVRSCANSLRRRGHLDAAIVRRQKLAAKARAKRNVDTHTFVRRDFAEYNISHASSKDVAYGDDETLLFADSSSCILQPEVTQGPYYIDGELIRSDLTEEQDGVPLFLDIQLVDTSTCSPVPAVFVDLWHCNATGVYAGVAASGNGDLDDTTNLDKTFLRGIQQTDINGVVQFETIVPGHYTGRASHIHVLSHNTDSTTVRTNGTLLAGGNNFTTSASHVGQIFFDQDLLSEVEATAPYSTNTQDQTTNEEDSILASEADTMDPFVEYILLDESDITQGIMAWISLGIDPTTDSSVTSAGTYYKSGGVANSNSGGGMGGGSSSNGTMGGGSAPSGTMAGSAMPSGTSSA